MSNLTKILHKKTEKLFDQIGFAIEELELLIRSYIKDNTYEEYQKNFEILKEKYNLN